MKKIEEYQKLAKINIYLKGEKRMIISKTKKLFVLILVFLMIFSITNSSYPGNSFATEKDNATESASKDTSDTIDIDETYPAVPSPGNNPSEGKGVFIRHVAHMPKFKENPAPFAQNQEANTPNQTPMAKDNSIPTVTGTVYQNDSFPLQLFKPNESVMSDVYNSNDLVFDSVVQNTYSLNDSVFGAYPIKSKACFYNVGFSEHSGRNLIKFSYGNANLLISP